MNTESQRRARQYEIDRICAAYADEVESGRNPNPKDYLTRYPQFATELADYIISYRLVLADMPEPDEAPDAALTPAFDRALVAIRDEEEQRIAQSAEGAAAPALTGLAARSFDVGADPETLAAKVGVSPSFIARLDEHAITAATIPAALFRRLAEALDVQVEAIRALLVGPVPGGQAGGAFYYADQAPATAQDDFLTAIAASDDLDEAHKAEWRAIAARGGVE